MATNNQKLKQYQGRSDAASNTPATSVRLAPDTPNRSFLLVQNTGANPGLMRLGEKVQGDGGDLSIPAGGSFGPFTIRESIPNEAINVGSVLATTWAILEGVTGG